MSNATSKFYKHSFQFISQEYPNDFLIWLLYDYIKLAYRGE